jgi:uncharacterized protein DUF3463
MQDTEWDKYGTGNYEKCADCMVHSGYEATAVMDSVSKPWKLAKLALAGIKTEGPMAPDIPLDRQRPADYVFSKILNEFANTGQPATAGPRKSGQTRF